MEEQLVRPEEGMDGTLSCCSVSDSSLCVCFLAAAVATSAPAALTVTASVTTTVHQRPAQEHELHTDRKSEPAPTRVALESTSFQGDPLFFVPAPAIPTASLLVHPLTSLGTED